MSIKKVFTIAGLLCLGLFVAVAVQVGFQPSTVTDTPYDHEASDASLTYFIDTVTAKAKMATEDHEQQGMGDGVDGTMLLKVYPGLTVEDFAGVRTLHGEYSVANGELVYTGNAPSNATVLAREGMQAVLKNVATRLDMPISTNAEIDLLLKRIEG